MAASAFPTLVECLSDLPDPRIARTRLHSLLDVLVIAICAVLCGAEGWDDMHAFGVAKRAWLQERLDLPHGIPSADTFRRVFARLEPSALQTCFRLWTQTLHQLTEGEVIALDGKVLRHSFDVALEQPAMHMVSAWAAEARLVLGQIKIVDKTNEIPMVPALLRLLDIRGCLVTTDAMSCQTETVAQIVEQGGGYVLAVKNNQKNLYHDIVARFTYAQEKHWRDMAHSVCTRTSRGHGRVDTRRCDLLTLDVDDLCWGDMQQQWRGLRSLARVTCTRQVGEQASEEVRYFISSVPDDAQKVLRAVRQHWGIENRLHHVLDVSLDEDGSRIRREHGAENMAVLRHIALNLLRQEKTYERGIKARQKRAGWDSAYLEQVLVS